MIMELTPDEAQATPGVLPGMIPPEPGLPFSGDNSDLLEDEFNGSLNRLQVYYSDDDFLDIICPGPNGAWGILKDIVDGVNSGIRSKDVVRIEFRSEARK